MNSGLEPGIAAVEVTRVLLYSIVVETAGEHTRHPLFPEVRDKERGCGRVGRLPHPLQRVRPQRRFEGGIVDEADEVDGGFLLYTCVTAFIGGTGGCRSV